MFRRLHTRHFKRILQVGGTAAAAVGGAVIASGVNAVSAGAAPPGAGVVGNGVIPGGIGVEGNGIEEGAGVVGNGAHLFPLPDGRAIFGSGPGVIGNGGTTNGVGVIGKGAGAGAGVFGTGGDADGAGVTALGGGNGPGVQGTATGSGSGVSGIGAAAGDPGADTPGPGVFGHGRDWGVYGRGNSDGPARITVDSSGHRGAVPAVGALGIAIQWQGVGQDTGLRNIAAGVVGIAYGGGTDQQGQGLVADGTCAGVAGLTSATYPAVVGQDVWPGVAMGTGPGVKGLLLNPENGNPAVVGHHEGGGAGVRGELASPDNRSPAVIGHTEGHGPGVRGEAAGSGPGVIGHAQGSGVGGMFENISGEPVAQMHLVPPQDQDGNPVSGLPVQGQSLPGQLFVDSNNVLWFNDGMNWRRIQLI